LTWAIKHVAAGLHLSSPLRVLYLGRIYNAWELPWTYSLVMVLATTPVLYLLFAAVSLSRLQIRVEAAKAPARSAAILGWLWVGIFLAAETRAPLRYDGSRHLLMIAPGFCLLVGLGLDSLLGWIEAGRLFQGTTRIRRIVRIACMGAVFGYMGLGLVWIHPYYNAYLNEVTNALLERAEDLFEVEYWGQSYKEGAEWLNLNAEPDADIYVGLNKQIADRYLNRKSRELNEHSLPEFEDPGRVAYFMVITRKAVYRESIEHIVRSFEPVFSIRRQKGTLLHVYTNRRVRTNSVSTSGSTQTH
jgi:hypothetical protein